MNSRSISRAINELQSTQFKESGIKYHEKVNEVSIFFWGEYKKVFKPAGIHSTEENVYISSNNSTYTIPLYLIKRIVVRNSMTIRKDESNKGRFYNRREYDAHEALLFKEFDTNSVDVNSLPPTILYDPEVQLCLADVQVSETKLDDMELVKFLNGKDNPLIRNIHSCMPSFSNIETMYDHIYKIVEAQENEPNCRYHISLATLTGEKISLLNSQVGVVNNFVVVSGREKSSGDMRKIYVKMNVLESIQYKKINNQRNKLRIHSIFDTIEYSFLFNESIISRIYSY